MTSLEPFERARKRVWEKLTAKEQNELADTCTIKDVWEVAVNIQEKQAKQRELGNMNKIKPYLDGLKRYDDVIGVFVSSNPGILALIWGPIKFLLQVASHYFHGYDKLLDVFYEIGFSFPQFQEIAEIFRGSDQMANYLGLFYADIIEFHYQAMRFFRLTRWKVLFECLWPKYEDTFDVISKNIEKHRRLIGGEVGIQVIKESRKARDEALKRHQEECNSKELERLERNFPPHDYKPLEKVRRGHCAETGKWIFSDPLFKSWLNAGTNEAKQRFLWLAGIPGAGKTFLCYSILQYLQEVVQADESTYILYAFPTYDDTSGNTEVAIIRSLLYQLCRANQSLIPAVNKEHDARHSRSLLSNTWDKLLETFICGSEPVYIILDGLDECDEVEREQLLKTMLRLWQNCSNLHILVASRKEVDIRRALDSNCKTLIVEEKNRSDIKRFVARKISDLWRKIRHIAEPAAGEFFKMVARSIVNQSEGMFLFARLMIAHLNAQPTVPEIMAEAGNLPSDLNEIYGRMLKRISTTLSPPEQATVKRIFSWLSCARQPLRTVELEHALLIQPGDNDLQHTRALYRDVLELCGPIVEKRMEYIMFTHFSAKEYVTNNSPDLWDGITKAESHAEVAVTCLSYLRFRYFDGDITDDEVDGFIDRGGYVLHQYSQSNFLHHIRGAWRDMTGPSEILRESTRGFLKERWNPSFNSEPPPGRSILGHLQSIDPGDYRRLSTVAAHLRARNLAESKNDMRQEPLLLTDISRRIAKRFDILASRLCAGVGHDTCASLHRYYGAELFYCPIPSCSCHRHGFETRDKREAHAAKHQRLFKCGVVECDFSSIGFESEADRADHISNCHHLAQAQQVEMTWEDMDYKHCLRVLCSAARERELGLVQSLLSLTSRNIVDPEDFGKLLLAAGEGQSADIIDLVISECKSIGHLGDLDKQLEKVLQNAALSGSEALVRGLCRSKPPIDLNARSTESLSSKAYCGYAPLHLAALGRKESIVELLLDSGARVDALSETGSWTALHLAAKVGHGSIARLLLEGGADIDFQKADGCTALHVAAWNGHEAIAQLLLDCKADIGSKKAGGKTVLHLAAENKREAISRLLLDRGAEIDARTPGGDTALIITAKKGREATSRLLLDRGAEIDAKDLLDRTALHKAARNGREAIVRLLLNREADIGARTRDGETALHRAAWSGNEATARLLIDRGADIGARKKNGDTALHRAAWHGNEAIARLLLDRGADIGARTNDDQTALYQAAEHEATARLLLDRGADVDAKKADGETALHRAVRNGNEAIARLLLDRGADIDAKNAKNETALHYATKNGHKAIAGLLRDRMAASK